MKKAFCIIFLVLFMAGNAFAAQKLSASNPISIDKENKTISFLATVNGKYLYQPTRHFAIHEGGKFGDKGVFKGKVPQLDFYNALIQLGAAAGNNMTMENKETTTVQGQAFKVTVTWEGAGREYTIDEVINDSNGKPILMRFGGNYENARKLNTGCLLCLDSCPVGIVSNTTYTYGAVEKRNEVAFTGNKNVLPGDGTEVVITLTVM